MVSHECLIFCGLSSGIVQQSALVDALVNKRIYAAGLDVMSPEPLPIDDILLKLENVGKLAIQCQLPFFIRAVEDC